MKIRRLDKPEYEVVMSAQEARLLISACFGNISKYQIVPAYMTEEEYQVVLKMYNDLVGHRGWHNGGLCK